MRLLLSKCILLNTRVIIQYPIMFDNKINGINFNQDDMKYFIVLVLFIFYDACVEFFQRNFLKKLPEIFGQRNHSGTESTVI